MSDKQNIVLSTVEKMSKVLSVTEDKEDIKNIAEKSKNKYNIIGFFEPVSGAGQTNIVVNAAFLLAEKGNSVCILDTDFSNPDIFRYYQKNGKETKSIIQLYRTPSMHIQEVTNKSIHKNIVYVSASYTDEVTDYLIDESFQEKSSAELETDGMDISETIYKMFSTKISELGALYDYVLIDIASDYTEILNMCSLRVADVVFTVIDSSIKSLESIAKIKAIYEKYQMKDVFTNIIQSKIIGKQWTAQEISTAIYNGKLVAQIPYSVAIEESCLAGDVFMFSVKQIDNSTLIAKEEIQRIVGTIINASRGEQISSIVKSNLLQPVLSSFEKVENKKKIKNFISLSIEKQEEEIQEEENAQDIESEETIENIVTEVLQEYIEEPERYYNELGDEITPYGETYCDICQSGQPYICTEYFQMNKEYEGVYYGYLGREAYCLKCSQQVFPIEIIEENEKNFNTVVLNEIAKQKEMADFAELERKRALEKEREEKEEAERQREQQIRDEEEKTISENPLKLKLFPKIRVIDGKIIVSEYLNNGEGGEEV